MVVSNKDELDQLILKYLTQPLSHEIFPGAIDQIRRSERRKLHKRRHLRLVRPKRKNT